MTLTLSEKPIVKFEAFSASFVKIADAMAGIKVPAPSWNKFTVPTWQKVGYDEKPIVDWVPTEVMPPLVTETLAETFLREMRAVITEVGPHHHCPIRYSRGLAGGGFSYVHEGEGDCLVGKVLIRMGHSASTISKYEGTSADLMVRRLYGNGEQVAVLARVAMAAQQVNDSRAPWGYALEIRA